MHEDGILLAYISVFDIYDNFVGEIYSSRLIRSGDNIEKYYSEADRSRLIVQHSWDSRGY